MINQQIHNYKIISFLGEGGIENVHLVEHISNRRKVKSNNVQAIRSF
jgi:hypothetical protein